MEILSDGRLYNWASILDDGTREQAERTASMGFIHEHLALMPDAHLGKGATVGSVIPTLAHVMPAAVGVDIGCGMIAVRTQFDRDSIREVEDRHGESLSRLRQDIERAIPLSPGKYNSKITATAKPRVERLSNLAASYDFDPRNYSKRNDWSLQLGSLGGGNHFVEVTLDETGGVWAFLHSGSRGVGNKIASHHIGVAVDYCERHNVELPDRDLAFLQEGTQEYDRYIHELAWAQEFALLNREEMMDRVLRQLSEYMAEPVIEQDRINCHHNYTSRETHYGQEVLVSRKGAIDAHVGVRGLIPGSMGTASYVVTGRGNVESFCSSPHGAGRVYSRTKAKKTFTLEQLQAAMTGIEWSGSEAFLDEIPEAYKDVDVVMADAADLVSIDHTLRQILNVKGS